ncbi:SET domain-containing protein [bacterium]|nr:MAG: SET domain-containing protein [bacterium]
MRKRVTTAKKTSQRAKPATKSAAKPVTPPATKGPVAKKAAAKKAAKKTATPEALAFVIKRSGIQGKGAFARQPIAKGERLIEYIGERISQNEAANRYDDAAMRRHHTFLFTISSRTCIDGNREGNDARYFNHSCSPNCETEVVRGRVYILARRNVLQGEELTYDYNYDLDGPITAESLQTYECRCGSPSCRGTILGPDARRRAPRGALAKLRAARAS